MNAEIEAKFLNIDHEALRRTLTEAGAVCEQPMRLMRRVTIETPELRAKTAFVRVRDEGHRVTMTYKQFDEMSINGAKEVEVIVSDFDKTIQLLSAAGLPYQSFQESKRETWRLNKAEIVLDEWPWLEPYIEIEAETEADVQETAKKLGLSWSDAVFGDVMAAYKAQYPHIVDGTTVGRIASVKFGDPLPDVFKAK